MGQTQTTLGSKWFQLQRAKFCLFRHKGKKKVNTYSEFIRQTQAFEEQLNIEGYEDRFWDRVERGQQERYSFVCDWQQCEFVWAALSVMGLKKTHIWRFHYTRASGSEWRTPCSEQISTAVISSRSRSTYSSIRFGPMNQFLKLVYRIVADVVIGGIKA